MPYVAIIVTFLLTLIIFKSLISIITSTPLMRDPKLPPGPRPLPVIGSLHMLTSLPHRALRDLAEKYGPIMSLQLGHVTTVVVSSSAAARLFLRTHDSAFSSRPHVITSDILSYGTKGMAFTKYGQYWRNVKKLCTMELLSQAKTDALAGSRREEVAALVAEIRKKAAAGEVVELSRKVRELVVDISCRMILGTNLEDRYRMGELVHETLCILGSFNVADYVPLLAPLDLQGFSRKAKKISKQMDEVLEKIIKEHEEFQRDQPGHSHQDFVDILLSLMNQPMNPKDEHVVDGTNIKAILLDMLIGSFDTSATAIDWTLCELLKNPRVLKKLQEELGNVVGMEKMVEHMDLDKLRYLDMVVKESLRLHPVAPLLIPHESMTETIIEGYCIPKHSRVIVNSWAMGRDPRVWSQNANEFFPERFIHENDVDLRGQDLRMIPFGAGRRLCPGINLGLIVVRFCVAQLVHCFDWELPDGLLAKDIDMTEQFGLSVGRANHLFAKPVYRLVA